MKKIVLAIICAGALTFTSCQEWLDINRDPNSATEANNGLIVPAAELNLITNYGLFANMLGAHFTDQWAVMPGGPNTFFFAQWNAQDGNSPATMADRMYTYDYVRIINNLKTVRDRSKTTNPGDYLVATVLRDFTYQTLVDTFGEIPYTEAENTSITSPKYDDGKDVYGYLIEDLKEAKKLVAESTGALACNNMLFNKSEDITNWVKFANALLLRLYMRESGVVDVKADVQALIEEDNFPDSDICFNSSLFSDEAGKENPLFNNYIRSVGNMKTRRSMDLVAHMCSIGTMGEYNDPRIPAKFKASVAYGNYEGNFICSQQSNEVTAKYVTADTFAEPNLDYNTPVYLITIADTEFLMAEYYLNAGKTGNAEAHYKAAIDASFAQCSVVGAEAVYGDNAPYKWDSAKGLELIGIQKWIANTSINGFESWCEMRRLGYPEICKVSGKDAHTSFCNMAKANIEASKENPTPTCKDMVVAELYTYGTIYSPTESTGLNEGDYIQRMGYPESSLKTNAKAPAQKQKTDKIFWAK